MFKMKKNLFPLAFLLFTGLNLWAGDIATFVDLGFSRDGNTYVFAQYGVRSTNLRPWADLFIVDVPANNFVSGGRINFLGDRAINAGQDGSSALYQIISNNTPIIERNNVNFDTLGKPLFLALDHGTQGDTIEFRDFENNITYRATLIPSFEGQGENLRSSFHINLERTNRDGTRNFTVGTPHLRRPMIESYRIRQVMVNPQNTSMILVIEMRQREGESVNVRYMVEALRF